jgi:cytochrome c-type biogenesis protein CcmH/NrfG
MPRHHAIVILFLCLFSTVGFAVAGVLATGVDGVSRDMGAMGEAPGAAPTAISTASADRVAVLEQEAQRSPDDVEVWLRLGRAYRDSGRMVEAVSAYVSASALAPRDTRIRQALADLERSAQQKGKH